MYDERRGLQQHFRFTIGDLLLLVTMIAILVSFLRLLSQLPFGSWWILFPCFVLAAIGGVIGARNKHGWHALRGAAWGTLVGGGAFALLAYPSMLVMAAAPS